MALLLDWRNVGQPDALLPAVDALRQGGIGVLPSESGYLLAANVRHSDAVGRLTQSPARQSPLAHFAASPAMMEELAASLNTNTRRLLSRVWPGPVGVSSFSSKSGERRHYRWPYHTAIEALASAIDFPLLLADPQHLDGTEEAAIDLADKAAAVDVIIDAGPISGRPLTWITADADGWRMEKPGNVSEVELVATAARWIVFVCTGNTCRSPMAEVLCKTRLAERLGCRIDELPARGYRVFSAGVSGYPGDAPSAEAVDVLRGFAADLSNHRSQPLSMEAVAHADWLIGMTRSHLLAVLTRYPVIGGSLRLLCGMDGDLDDPIGGSIDVYAACARTILRHVDRLILELVPQ
jgi:protein-tyrosine phosphatase